ncbi:MAG TPA: DUF4384 domain-containing protein [Gemmatimonadales bacterium]|jgi:hypothetical protein
MFLNLLLPLLLASGPAEPAVAKSDDPPIQIWINNDGRFLRGDRAKVHVRTDEDGYLVVLHVDAEGHLRVLFPIDPTDDNFVRGGRKYEVEGRGGRDAFDVGDRSGRGYVYAAVSSAPYRFDEFVLSDHWDYKALEPNRLAADPEPEVTELVRRMAQGSFDYDVMSYHVVDRVVYADDYSYSRPYYDDFYYGGFGCGYYGGCGSSISVGLFFGRPFHHRRFYGPYHYAYDPFYDPFFYDPWYYRPYYYRPFYHRPYFYRPVYYYGYPYYYRNGSRPIWPHRFRDRTLVNGDYRDRRYTFGRAVNTVYTPPISRFAEPDNSSPVRRAVDRFDPDRQETTPSRRTADRTKADDRPDAGRGAQPRSRGGTPGSAEPRRRVDHRNESAPIEARRARPRETPHAAPDVRGRQEPLPVDVSPRRSIVDRSGSDARRVSDDRSGVGDERSRVSSDRVRANDDRAEVVARPARRSSESPSREIRSDPRSSDRGDRGDRGGYRGGDDAGRVQRAPSSSSGSSWGGGWSGGDRGGGGGGGNAGSVSSGGGRRR